MWDTVGNCSFVAKSMKEAQLVLLEENCHGMTFPFESHLVVQLVFYLQDSLPGVDDRYKLYLY
jgi:hypothetical protein